MNVIIDMGTTNTRFYLVDNNTIIQKIHKSFGARIASEKEKNFLYASLKKGIQELFELAGIKISKLTEIVAYGMIGSEFGLAEVERISTPVTKQVLAENIKQFTVPEIADVPFFIIPGVYYENSNDGTVDVMRGEETEAIGFIESVGLTNEVIVVLPGTHCKILQVSKKGEIISFSSSMTGEMIASLSKETILKTAVDVKSEISLKFLKKGAKAVQEKGINCALFDVRAMVSSQSVTINERTSYFLGAVLSDEIKYITSRFKEKHIVVGGNSCLKEIYVELLKYYSAENVEPIEDSEFLGVMGAMEIVDIKNKLTQKREIIEEIKKEKLVAIVRGLKREDYLPTVSALVDGGIRLVEIPFDSSGKQNDEEIGGIVKELSEKFEGKLHIGVGSVLNPGQVKLAFDNGAKYVISPNFDKEVVKETISFVMVSIPGCYTPSEMVEAYGSGSDFIKVFPNDCGKAGYIKAIHTPLSHIPLIAVGGVDENNIESLLLSGAVGVGIGSTLTDKDAISKGDFEVIRKKAISCVKAVERYKQNNV